MSNSFDPRCHVGETHGIYTLVDVLAEKDKYGHYIYKGECIECGHALFSHYGKFSGEKSKTTSCNHLDATGRYVVCTAWDNQKIGDIFSGMKTRCYNTNDRSFCWYGAKGIKICEEWLDNPKSFEDWAVEHGYEDGLTIDRIDENKNYCPENCRWISFIDNSKYKSTTSLIDVDGEIHTGRDWSKFLNLGTNTINTYIRTYGLDNTIEFIRRYKSDSTLALSRKGKQSYYSLYMDTYEE